MSSSAITYGQFARLAKAKGWTAPYLAERFRGKVESPSELFHRVMDPQNAGCAIAYRSVIQFYFENIDPPADAMGRKTCPCGCGHPLYGRKKLATGACRMRMYRKRSETRQNGVQQLNKDKAFSVTKTTDPGIRRMVTV